MSFPDRPAKIRIQGSKAAVFTALTPLNPLKPPLYMDCYSFTASGCMAYTIAEISKILGSRGQIVSPQATIRQLLTDSRNVSFGAESLFFAISGRQHDGHAYVEQAYTAGVRSFVVEHLPAKPHADANYVLTDNSIAALQQITAAHRRQFTIPVIGITGSNGKTIVKEWLYHLLKQDLDIVRSPRSYNSQIGVPLSVWEMDAQHQVGIFEAGISLPGEMSLLEAVIQPTIGIITNIADPHREGFTSDAHKLTEKLRLFDHCDTIVYCADHALIHTSLHADTRCVSWSKKNADAEVQVYDIEQLSDSTAFRIQFRDLALHFRIPFTDEASLENSVHALITALLLAEQRNALHANTIEHLTAHASTLPGISMRLELKRGMRNCLIVNDSYSADLASLEIALRFQAQHGSGLQRTVIITDFDESGMDADTVSKKVADMLRAYDVQHVITIGEGFLQHQEHFHNIPFIAYRDTETFLQFRTQADFENEVILIKGARRFRLERISRMLEAKTHGTVLRIHLHHMVHNLHVYRNLLQPGVKTMAMVKAFSYGSGQAEIARLLAHQRVDYLAVAYADEGVELRTQGIRLPIMVMNPEPETFASLIAHQLEPEIYSFRILQAWQEEVRKMVLTGDSVIPPIHIKLDTGMHRLGFSLEDTARLTEQLRPPTGIRVASIFTHLSSSDEKQHDAFTQKQLHTFRNASDAIISALGYPVLRHALNSSGISNYPDAQFDMVRLGIGLYGVDPAAAIQQQLKPVSSLETTIAQIRTIEPGDSVGYSRTFIANAPTRIATINLGYADGFSRDLSNGKGKVVVIPAEGRPSEKHVCPVVGRVCMDMTMIDITHVPDVHEGDVVEIFGSHISISDHAAMRGTIAYEVMTGISQRVKRVYESEG